MEVGVPAIVHDLVSPCQLDGARFAPVRVSRPFRATGFARPVCAIYGINNEESWGLSVTPTTVLGTYTKWGSYLLLVAAEDAR